MNIFHEVLFSARVEQSQLAQSQDVEVWFPLE